MATSRGKTRPVINKMKGKKSPAIYLSPGVSGFATVPTGAEELPG